MPFATRPTYDWRLRTRSLALGRRTLIMGILNITPDSFSDGGHFYTPGQSPHRALEHALQMLDEGADILDLGGESTRPGATPLTPDEEQARILPALEAILRERPSAIVSIDTFHAATARRAIEAGAEIVNDVSGLLWDVEMSSICAHLACGTILMHTRGTPAEWPTLPPLTPEEIAPLVLRDLEAVIATAKSAGILLERIVIDPGLGFGKRLDENYPLLAHLEAFQRLGLPILIGLSRKSFLGETIARTLHREVPPASERLHATTAANVAAILGGAHILRVHDVRSAAEAAAIADAILNKN